jgi:hypothetical protein
MIYNKKLYQKMKAMKLTKQKTERRRFKRHKVSRKPIAILGPNPVRVGHVTIISDDAAEIQFSETNGSAATKFSELVVLIPEYNSVYISGKIHVETVSCSTARMNGSGLQSRMRKRVPRIFSNPSFGKMADVVLIETAKASICSPGAVADRDYTRVADASTKII